MNPNAGKISKCKLVSTSSAKFNHPLTRPHRQDNGTLTNSELSLKFASNRAPSPYSYVSLALNGADTLNGMDIPSWENQHPMNEV